MVWSRFFFQPIEFEYSLQRSPYSEPPLLLPLKGGGWEGVCSGGRSRGLLTKGDHFSLCPSPKRGGRTQWHLWLVHLNEEERSQGQTQPSPLPGAGRGGGDRGRGQTAGERNEHPTRRDAIQGRPATVLSHPARRNAMTAPAAPARCGRSRGRAAPATGSAGAFASAMAKRRAPWSHSRSMLPVGPARLRSRSSRQAGRPMPSVKSSTVAAGRGVDPPAGQWRRRARPRRPGEGEGPSRRCRGRGARAAGWR